MIFCHDHDVAVLVSRGMSYRPIYIFSGIMARRLRHCEFLVHSTIKKSKQLRILIIILCYHLQRSIGVRPHFQHCKVCNVSKLCSTTSLQQ